jgi:hypothetical protein
MKMIDYRRYQSIHMYTVELSESDQRRSDSEIITACDNHFEFDQPVNHFGGHVDRHGNTAVVSVYVD